MSLITPKNYHFQEILAIEELHYSKIGAKMIK